MSLNTAHAYGGVLIFNGECILLYVDNIEVKFEKTNDCRLQGSKCGRIYLTTHRMIFVNNNQCDPLQSMTFPFFRLSCIELEQPLFGCNHIKGLVKSLESQDLHMDPWTGTAYFKMYFKSGGAVDFGMALLQAAKMASQHMHNHPPPPYVPPIEPYQLAPRALYTPPPGTFGMVLPTHVFPFQPPSNSVFMTEQPPPYPGLNTNPQGYPGAFANNPGRCILASSVMKCPCPHPQQPDSFNPCFPCDPCGPCDPCHPCANPNYCQPYYLCAGADNPKAQEAAASAQPAYFDPNNPHTTYMPTAPPPYVSNSQPPSYAEATKKSQ